MDPISKAISKMFRSSRLLWDSSEGTAIRVEDHKGRVSYALKAPVKVKKWKPTEAQDNAIGRAQRRRRNRALRGWLPFAQR